MGPSSFILLSLCGLAVLSLESDRVFFVIENGTLRGIIINGRLPAVMSFPGNNLSAIAETAFANCSSLIQLGLAFNELENLPTSVFSNLINLEHLNVSFNKLHSINFCAGLNRLKTLDISHNPVTQVRAGDFFGLSKSVTILTQALDLECINLAMFENPLKLRKATGNRRTSKLSEPNLGYNGSSTASAELNPDMYFNYDTRWENSCINNSHLWSVSSSQPETGKTTGCKNIERFSGVLNLNQMDIETFERGWYRPSWRDIVHTVDLKKNRIVQVTEDLLNDLPHPFAEISLQDNKIQEIKANVMKNSNSIHRFNLRGNCITEIEVGAFKDLDFVQLQLDGNRLEDTKFLDSLPGNTESVTLTNNYISEISPGDFAKSKKLVHLNLSYNRLTKLQVGRLQRMSSLRDLRITDNYLREIEAGFFRDLTGLLRLNLERNSISTLEPDVFDGLKLIQSINLTGTRLSIIKIGAFSHVPNTLKSLDLSHNKMQILAAGTFVNVPRDYLTLSCNNISKIEEGAFRGLQLWILELRNNSLTTINPVAFKGLTNLRHLGLANNNIHQISKGAVRYLKNLATLDLDNNRVKLLKNGALFGISKTTRTDGCPIRLAGVPVGKIRGGLFDFFKSGQKSKVSSD